MTIAVTEQAAGHVQRQLEARGRGEGIRIAVKTSGCSGLAYVLEFVDAAETTDTIFEDFGVVDDSTVEIDQTFRVNE